MTENETISGETQRFLSFFLASEQYAIPLLSVKEVIAMPEVTPIPNSPSHFLGIMNLRGQVISVIDLRSKFGIKGDTTQETAVVICDLGTVSLGVVVSKVDSVLSLTPKDIHPKPDTPKSKNADSIFGVAKKGDQLILLIEIDKALEISDYTTQKPSKSA